MNPFNFAPSRRMISSRVASFRVDTGGRGPGMPLSPSGVADRQFLAPLIFSALVSHSLHFASNACLSLGAAANPNAFT